jgi:hypothetical protein
MTTRTLHSSGAEVSDCIIFAGAKNDKGYGIVRRDGKSWKAHRLAYCEHHGLSREDIAGKVLRHTCDTRACINPHHLVLGTQQENLQDMRDKGRANTTGLKRGNK